MCKDYTKKIINLYSRIFKKIWTNEDKWYSYMRRPNNVLKCQLFPNKPLFSV